MPDKNNKIQLEIEAIQKMIPMDLDRQNEREPIFYEKGNLDIVYGAKGDIGARERNGNVSIYNKTTQQYLTIPAEGTGEPHGVKYDTKGFGTDIPLSELPQEMLTTGIDLMKQEGRDATILNNALSEQKSKELEKMLEGLKLPKLQTSNVQEGDKSPDGNLPSATVSPKTGRG